jgi:hypothetical protein
MAGVALTAGAWWLGYSQGCGVSSNGCMIGSLTALTKEQAEIASDPNERMKELLNQSEDLRQIQHEWQRIWFADQPSHRTPEQVDRNVQ